MSTLTGQQSEDKKMGKKMKIFYSPETKGFYNSIVHKKNIPDDCFEISQKCYEDLLVNQSKGLEIVFIDGKLMSRPEGHKYTNSEWIIDEEKQIESFNKEVYNKLDKLASDMLYNERYFNTKGYEKKKLEIANKRSELLKQIK